MRRPVAVGGARVSVYSAVEVALPAFRAGEYQVASFATPSICVGNRITEPAFSLNLEYRNSVAAADWWSGIFAFPVKGSQADAASHLIGVVGCCARITTEVCIVRFWCFYGFFSFCVVFCFRHFRQGWQGSSPIPRIYIYISFFSMWGIEG